jgi:hypothetical protein
MVKKRAVMACLISYLWNDYVQTLLGVINYLKNKREAAFKTETKRIEPHQILPSEPQKYKWILLKLWLLVNQFVSVGTELLTYDHLLPLKMKLLALCHRCLLCFPTLECTVTV